MDTHFGFDKPQPTRDSLEVPVPWVSHEQLTRQFAAEVHAFKVGINRPRSRGDKAEPFGGPGASASSCSASSPTTSATRRPGPRRP